MYFVGGNVESKDVFINGGTSDFWIKRPAKGLALFCIIMSGPHMFLVYSNRKIRTRVNVINIYCMRNKAICQVVHLFRDHSCTYLIQQKCSYHLPSFI